MNANYGSNLTDGALKVVKFLYQISVFFGKMFVAYNIYPRINVLVVTYILHEIHYEFFLIFSVAFNFIICYIRINYKVTILGGFYETEKTCITIFICIVMYDT